MQPVVIPDGDLHVADGAEYRRVTFGAGQPEYEPLDAIVLTGDSRTVLTRWEPSEAEREAIARGASIDLAMLTFGQPLQPVLLGVQGVTYVSPALIPPEHLLTAMRAAFDEEP